MIITISSFLDPPFLFGLDDPIGVYFFSFCSSAPGDVFQHRQGCVVPLPGSIPTKVPKDTIAAS